MGGHGGLNILPQKKWNVYNYDNRDIVDKDKKIHAQKMRNNYQTDRKNALQNKFQVLKAQSSQHAPNQEQFKNQVKKDSILNHEFKRLAEDKQHVNLFEHEQKILENREVFEYKKLKEAQFLKGKDLDYSSKFLGTYNEDSKIPWYAKTKIQKENSNLRKQRYDMEDLVDQIRQEKDRSRNRYYRESIREKQQGHRFEDRNDFNLKRQEINQERERSRDRKYEFLKIRDELSANRNKMMECKQQIERIEEKPQQNQLDVQVKKSSDMDNKKQDYQMEEANVQPEQKKQLTKQQQQEIQKLRQKRLKRQQKERKRINQLKRKLLENSE